MLFSACISYAIAAVLDHQLIAHFSDSLYIALTFGIPGILLLPLNLLSLKKIKQPYKKGNFKIVILNAIPIALSFFFTFQAYHLGGSAGQVYSVLSMEAIVAVIAAAIFLNDRKNLPLKILAATIAGLGVYLLAV